MPKRFPSVTFDNITRQSLLKELPKGMRIPTGSHFDIEICLVDSIPTLIFDNQTTASFSDFKELKATVKRLKEAQSKLVQKFLDARTTLPRY